MIFLDGLAPFFFCFQAERQHFVQLYFKTLLTMSVNYSTLTQVTTIKMASIIYYHPVYCLFLK